MSKYEFNTNYELCKQDNQECIRPLTGGVPIKCKGSGNETSGTLGLFAQPRISPDVVWGIVDISFANTSKPGDAIYQPEFSKEEREKYLIGEVVQNIFDEKISCSVVEIYREFAEDAKLNEIQGNEINGLFDFSQLSSLANKRVKKISADAKVQYGIVLNPNESFQFGDVHMIEQILVKGEETGFVEYGEAGGILLTVSDTPSENNLVIGMLNVVANLGDEQVGLFSRMDTILQSIDADLFVEKTSASHAAKKAQEKSFENCRPLKAGCTILTRKDTISCIAGNLGMIVHKKNKENESFILCSLTQIKSLQQDVYQPNEQSKIGTTFETLSSENARAGLIKIDDELFKGNVNFSEVIDIGEINGIYDFTKPKEELLYQRVKIRTENAGISYGRIYGTDISFGVSETDVVKHQMRVYASPDAEPLSALVYGSVVFTHDEVDPSKNNLALGVLWTASSNKTSGNTFWIFSPMDEVMKQLDIECFKGEVKL